MSISSLVLTDGTTTATLTDGTNYALHRDGWAPSVAQLQFDALGNGYTDVEEELTVDITGASLSALLTNERTLTYLLERAQRFASGDLTVSPVTLQITMLGSTVKTAMVLGGSYERPKTFVNLAGVFEIDSAKITILRRGLWLGAAESAVTSGSTAPGAIWSATTTPTHPVLSPIDLRWQLPTLSATRGYFMGTQMLAVVASASDITAIEAESGAYGANIATTVIANARGGNVARYTPGAQQSDITLTGLPTAVGRYAVYASMSTNSPNDGQFTVRANFGLYGSSGVFNPLVAVPTLRSLGQVCDAIFLGIVTIPIASSARVLVLELNSSTTIGGYYLDLDYVVLVRLAATTTIITVNSDIERGPLYAFGDFGASATQRQNLQHLLTSQIMPIPYLETNTGSVQGILEGVNGSLLIHTVGTNVSGIWMAANHANSGTAEFNGGYRLADAANAVYSSVYTVTRSRGYVVPE